MCKKFYNGELIKFSVTHNHFKLSTNQSELNDPPSGCLMKTFPKNILAGVHECKFDLKLIKFKIIFKYTIQYTKYAINYFTLNE